MHDLIEREYQAHQDVHDRDAETKGKTKDYADKQRHARESDIMLGDQVLMKQDKTNKLTTQFAPTPHMVVKKAGSSVIVKSPSGATYSRNTSHLKRFVTSEDVQDNKEAPCKQPVRPDQETVITAPNPEVQKPTTPPRPMPTSPPIPLLTTAIPKLPTPSRPRRTITLPKRLKNCELSKK